MKSLLKINFEINQMNCFYIAAIVFVSPAEVHVTSYKSQVS